MWCKKLVHDISMRGLGAALLLSSAMLALAPNQAAALDVTQQAESWMNMSGVQTETTTDTGGGLNVGWIDAGDWIAYNKINIPSTGSYTVQYRVSSLSGGGRIRLDHTAGATVLGEINVPSTGGWQTWTTISHTVTISAGNLNFGIYAVSAGFNINYFRIFSAGGGGSSESCPQWVAGQNYVTGNKVTYNGNYYVAEHDNPGYDPTISTWYWDPTTCSGSSGGGGGGGTGFTSLFTESMFNQMFPNRNSFYTYQGLVDAQKIYSAFGGSGDDAMKKREIAAAMANFHHETGGLVYVTEQNTANHCSYCDARQPYGCPAGSCNYYGRGPIQLSWNFNYKAAGDAIGINILNDPNQVQNNPATAWKTALWYWMSQNGPNVRTAHDCIVGNHGFGCTIRTINGSLECDGKYPATVTSRVDQFNRAKSIIGATSVGDDRC